MTNLLNVPCDFWLNTCVNCQYLLFVPNALWLKRFCQYQYQYKWPIPARSADDLTRPKHWCIVQPTTTAAMSRIKYVQVRLSLPTKVLVYEMEKSLLKDESLQCEMKRIIAQRRIFEGESHLPSLLFTPLPMLQSRRSSTGVIELANKGLWFVKWKNRCSKMKF